MAFHWICHVEARAGLRTLTPQDNSMKSVTGSEFVGDFAHDREPCQFPVPGLLSDFEDGFLAPKSETEGPTKKRVRR